MGRVIRDESIRALAEARAMLLGRPPNDRDAKVAEEYMNELTLARRLDLGTAWDMAVEALLEGWAINMLWGTTTEDRWAAHAGPFPVVEGRYRESVTTGGATPTEALVALAAALRERAR